AVAPDAGPVLSGKVSMDGAGIAGAEVLLYDPQFFLPPVRPPGARGESGADGAFRLQAPAGRYLLVARRGERFAFFGRNPVRLDHPVGGIHLPLVPVHPLARSEVPPGEEALEGQVLHGGRPVADARVFVYLDPARGFRGPGFALSEPTDADGRFHIPLPPGTYFAVARFRPQGWKTGGLEPGDQFGVLPELPLVLREGERAEVAIETVEVPSLEQMARYQGRSGVLSGRVVDQHGRPLAGLRACLYDNPQMLDQPLAVSEPTGPDGRFTLKTDRAGTLFLGARVSLGGPPGLNEPMGFYRGPDGTRLDLAPEQRLEDLTIVVTVRR
ncbi:MAG: hypothetical protein P1P84_12545, partial [Deferrisomatales bacterium]|nr:hypothetical protein [Deferrisomatales bacterium]